MDSCSGGGSMDGMDSSSNEGDIGKVDRSRPQNGIELELFLRGDSIFQDALEISSLLIEKLRVIRKQKPVEQQIQRKAGHVREYVYIYS